MSRIRLELRSNPEIRPDASRVNWTNPAGASNASFVAGWSAPATSRSDRFWFLMTSFPSSKAIGHVTDPKL